MNTKLIMTASALILGIIGVLLTFIPDTILGHLNIDINTTSQFLMQIIGALYFSFAMLNWMMKTSLIGGIYNRPIAIANFSHFLIAGLALVKGIIANPGVSYTIWTAGIIYSLFAVSFGIVLFRHPVDESKSNK